MYRFDGVIQSARTGTAFSLAAEFALGVSFRTTTAAQGCLLGLSDDDDDWFQVMLNEDDGEAHVEGMMNLRFSAGGKPVDIAFDGGDLFDGELHTLVVWRQSNDFIKVYLDGDVVVEDADATTLANDPIAANRAMGLACVNNDGAADWAAAVELGEFWLINGAVSGAHAFDWMTRGLSARSMDEAIDYYWPGYLSNDAVIGGDTLTNTGVACDHPIMAVAVVDGAPVVETAVNYGDPAGPRYEVFIGDGSPADPEAVDPVCVVPRAITTPWLYGTLPASSTVFVSIYAANETGRAEEAAAFTIPTDGAGLPLLVPAVPTEVRAELQAGGEVRLSWRYVETSPVAAAIADTFEISIAELLDPGQISAGGFLPIQVSHTQPRERYSYTIDSLTSGRRYALSVAAFSAGALSAGRSAQVIVRPDADAPADLELSMAMA